MAWLHGLGLLSAVGYGLLGWLNRSGRSLALGEYFPLLGLCWLCLGGAAWILSKRKFNHLVLPIVVWAILFRLIGWISQPVLEDDFYRYLWDGRQTALHGNPYGSSPKDHFEDPDLDSKFETILSRINYPHLPTIYAPVLQFVFAAAYTIAPGELWALKGFLLAADVIAGALLFRLGGNRALLLYGWCPLLIQETAFTAHPDILGALFMMAAYSSRQAGKPVQAGVLLGLSVGTKITGAVFAPFLLKGQPPKSWAAAALTMVTVYLPFWMQGSLADWNSLLIFAKEWEFNSGGFALLKAVVGSSRAAPLALGLIVVPLAVLWWRSHPWSTLRGDWVFGWFFAWSAVVQPWYLLWLLPWIALFPSPAGVASLVVVSLSYITWLHLGVDRADVFAHPPWVRPLEYGMVLLALALGTWWRCRSIKPRTGSPGPLPRLPASDGR